MEIDSLSRYINSKHGGHVIPFIDIDNFFKKKISL